MDFNYCTKKSGAPDNDIEGVDEMTVEDLPVGQKTDDTSPCDQVKVALLGLSYRLAVSPPRSKHAMEK